jgi:hypothetical protein
MNGSYVEGLYFNTSPPLAAHVRSACAQSFLFSAGRGALNFLSQWPT